MIKVYVCGPTVYNDIHIGNLRPIITIDLILKAARNLNIDFTFIHNITDIDDKIINKSLETKKTENEISKKYANKYLKILNQTKVDTISKVEFVTENLDVIENYINMLLKTNNAYITNEGNVLFDVKKNENNYGTVSNQNLDKMIFQDTDINKRYKADFSLWKKTTLGIKFSSIFGKGRPGWHTECCALIYKHFGKNGVDFHGGGVDLIFPHHENENIQHFALFNKNLSKNWLRCGQINLKGEKMSKSLGNVWLAKDFLKQHDSNVFRMIIINSNITAPINISEETIEFAKSTIKKLNRVMFNTIINSNQNENFDKEEYNLYNNFILEKNFSGFNFKVNETFKELNKNFDPNKSSTLIKVFTDLGFVFDLQDINQKVLLYHKWKNLISQKDYEKADIIRKILIDAHLL